MVGFFSTSLPLSSMFALSLLKGVNYYIINYYNGLVHPHPTIEKKKKKKTYKLYIYHLEYIYTYRIFRTMGCTSNLSDNF